MVFLSITVATGVALASAAATAIGGIAKAVNARKQRRAQRAAMQKMQDEENAWYAKKINEDFLQRAESQAALERLRKTYMRTIDEAQARQDMLGGSNASAASAKEAAGQNVADASAQIVGQSSAARDHVDESHRQANRSLQEKEMAMSAQEAEARNDAIDIGVNTINSAGAAYLAGQTGTAANANNLKAANTTPSVADNPTLANAQKTVDAQVAANTSKVSALGSGNPMNPANEVKVNPVLNASTNNMRNLSDILFPRKA